MNTHFLSQSGLDYINRGRAVLILSADKVPFRGCDDCTGVSSAAHYAECVCLKEGNVCHGFYAATRDPEVLSRWLEEYPEATGIAQRTGRESGVFVLETDDGGQESLAALEATYGVLPETEMHMSQSGGIHYVFAMPEGMEVRTHIKKLGKGLDIKGQNAYALLPPSRGDKGQYRTLNTTEPVQAPQWLLEKIAEFQTPKTRGEFRTFEPDSVPENISRKAQDTIRYWVGRIITAEDGEQNKLIYTASRVFFSLAQAGVIDEEDAQTLLEDAAAEGKHPEDRAAKAIKSGRSKADSQPDPVEDALNMKGTYLEGKFNRRYSLDVPGMYSRFLAKHKDDIAFIPERKVWASYSDRDGTWVLGNPSKTSSDKSVVKHHVTDTLFNLSNTERELWTAEPSTGNPERSWREVFDGFVAKVNSTTAMNKSIMETLDYNTPSTDGIYAPTLAFNQFDSRGDILPFRNGLVDLETGEFRPYTKDDRVTEYLPWDYKASAECPEFDAYLKRAQPDPEIRDYLQRVAGYTIQGSTSEKKFFIHQGIADGGKSTFAMILASILSHFAHTADRDLFHKGGEETAEKKANLFRKRMILLDEWQISEKVNAALLKSVAAGSPDNGRFLYGQDFGFRHTGKVHITTNADVKMDLDSGLITRLTVVPWNSPVSPKEKERQAEKFGGVDFNVWVIENELMGIINWAVQGYAMWRKQGLSNPPKALEDAKQEYLESDPVKSFFFNEWTWTRDPNDKITTADFFEAFKESYDGPAEELSGYTATKVNTTLRNLQVTFKRGVRVNGSSPTTAFIGIKRKEK